MKEQTDADKPLPQLRELTEKVMCLSRQRRYQEAAVLAAGAMGEFPHEPQPHNLLGLLLEMQGDHLSAMKHFRAAWALDPTYKPARTNMDHYGSFYPTGGWAFKEEDCPRETRQTGGRTIGE